MNNFDWKNPDYAPIVAERIERLRRMRANPAVLADLTPFYTANPARFISDWGQTLDPRNPERGLPASVPFVLFPRQVDLIHYIMERWKGQEPGLIEKSRDIGASWLIMALAVTLCTFNKGLTIGIGSRKEQLLDNAGDPSSLFFKARMFHESLPPELRTPMQSAHMRLTFNQTGSAIVGEAGDQIGRGARCSLFLLDESAFIERPESVEASLSATTNCRIDVSSVNGLDNPFAQKRFGGKVAVFTFSWRSDPRKDDEWYAKKCDELPPHVVASEIDLNYRSSNEDQLIPSLWVNAAVDAHVKLGIEPTGARFAGLDVADQGKDDCAFASRHGVLLDCLRSWSGRDSDIFKTTIKAFAICDELGLQSFHFDQDGLGAGIVGDSNAINLERERAGNPTIEALPFRGSASPWNPDGSIVPGRKNKDLFLNAKSQAWWSLRARFENTYKAVVDKLVVDLDNIIAIDSQIPDLLALQMELSQPTFSTTAAGKVQIDKAPDGMPSPDLADAVMIAFQPQKPAGFFSGAMLTPRVEAKPSQPAYPSPMHRIFAVVGASLISQPLGIHVIYFGIVPRDVSKPRLYVLDWHVTALADARLDEWIKGVYTRLAELNKVCQLLDTNPGIYCERTGFGPSFYDAAIEAQRDDVHFIPEPLANLDLLERAAAAARYMTSGQMEIIGPAREKKLPFRGTTENHLTAEIMSFNAANPDQSAELASAFYLGVLLALEDPPRQ